jgi:putative hydrolase of the HAD superfamily
MYRHASDALGIEPADCLFVDDDPSLVAAAIDLGYQGRWMRCDSRAGEYCDQDVQAIVTLSELIQLFPIV